MKFSVVVCVLVVCVAFAGRVWAQCEDYAACAGQRADAQAKLSEWYRATAVAVAEERQAIATGRAYERKMALTATEAARPTRTPMPTATSTQIVVIVQVVQTIQVTVPAAAVQAVAAPSNTPATQATTSDRSMIYILGGIVILLVLVSVVVMLFRPQTFVLPNRPRR